MEILILTQMISLKKSRKKAFCVAFSRIFWLANKWVNLMNLYLKT